MTGRLSMWWKTKSGKHLARFIRRSGEALSGPHAAEAAATLRDVMSRVSAMTPEERRRRGLDPHVAAGYVLLGRHAAAAGDPKTAMQCLEAARGCGKLDPEDLRLLADLMAGTGRQDEQAWTTYLEACGEGATAPTRGPMVAFLRAQCEITPLTPADQFLERGARSERLCRAGGHWPWALYSAAYTAKMDASRAREFGKYLEAFERTVPRDPEAVLYHARTLSLAGQYDRASTLFAGIGADMKDSWVHLYALGVHRMRMTQWDGARQSLEACERVMGRPSACVQLQRGHLALMRAHLAEAATCYAKARELAPTDWRPVYWLGRAALCLGKLREAFAAFQQSARLGSRTKGLFAAAVVSELLGRFEEAGKLYDLCVKKAVKREPVLLRRALCLAARDKLREARDLLAPLTAGGEHADAARYYTGVLLAREGKYADAIETWLRVAEKPWTSYTRPRLAAARCLAAEQRFSEQRWDEAVDLWRKALDSLPDEHVQIVRGNIAEAEFRKVAALASRQDSATAKAQALADILPGQPSPRREHYAFVRAVALRESETLPAEWLCRNEHYGARARFHRGILQMARGEHGEVDLEDLASAGPQYRLHALLMCARCHLSRNEKTEAVRCLSTVIALFGDPG